MRYEKGTFITVPNIDCLSEQPSELQAIYLWLCSYADKDGRCFPARRTLAKRAGCSLKTLDKYMEKLVEIGLVTKESRQSDKQNQKLSNMYQLLILEGVGYEVDKGSSKNATRGSSKSATVTKPIINQTYLTSIALDQNDQTQPQSTDIMPVQEKELPNYLGKIKLTRVVRFYDLLWRNKYGNFPTATAWGKVGGLLKPILQQYSEYQIASLLIIHFSWHGTSGNDEFIYKQMSNRGFSLTDFRKNVDLYIAYLTNSIGVVYNDQDSVVRYVVKQSGDIIRKYKDEKESGKN